MTKPTRVPIVDSHTEGEPTRVVISGGPDLGSGSALVRRERFRTHHDAFRRSLVLEPRGFEAMVGALLLEPDSAKAAAQVIFFNNAGYLNMCVHGAIGVGVTLLHLGRIHPGTHLLETPAGEVTLQVAKDRLVSVHNVLSYRHAASVTVEVPGFGPVTGDVAWGGNWFFLVENQGPAVHPENISDLTRFTKALQRALTDAGVTGAEGLEIDHVEVFGPPSRPDANSKNFVLCPGGEYDRSPCGTGTSAKLACLAADKKLLPGDVWRQESILGTLFTGTFAAEQNGVNPVIAGRAWVTGEATLLFDADDPFAHGIDLQ